MLKKALIIGANGQDGSYLCEFLLKKGYYVYAGRRKTSYINPRLDSIFLSKKFQNRFELSFIDLTDPYNILNFINEKNPHEIYNLGAQSHVGISFIQPSLTCNINAQGTLNVLEAIRSYKFKNNIKFYQASSSEMFGDTDIVPQNEFTPMSPSSPYGVSKLFAYHMTKVYRDAFGLFASNGILFNHESPRRGEFFVTRKITSSLVKIKFKQLNYFSLGNLDSKRDWGHASEYVEAMWKILQLKNPTDLVISNEKQYTIRDFVKIVCKILKINIEFKGKGLNEVGIDKDTKKIILKVDKNYFRPIDVTNLLGDSKKAKKLLKWNPKINIEKLAELMVESDLNLYS